MADSIPLKQCCRKDKCVNPLGSWLPATTEYFRCVSGAKASKSGLRGSCRECDKAYKRQYREIHHEEHLQSTRDWRAKNPQKVKAYSRKYYDEHAEERRKYSLNWRLADPERARELKRSNYQANIERERNRARVYRKNHPDAAKLAATKYDIAHRQKRRDSAKARWWGDPEKYRSRMKEVRDANPERTRAEKARRRIAEKQAGVRLTKELIASIYEECNGRCVYCGMPVFWDIPRDVHIDHSVPVSRGGTNAEDNLFISCWTCNSSKNDKTFTEWVDTRGW